MLPNFEPRYDVHFVEKILNSGLVIIVFHLRFVKLIVLFERHDLASSRLFCTLEKGEFDSGLITCLRMGVVSWHEPNDVHHAWI